MAKLNMDQISLPTLATCALFVIGGIVLVYLKADTLGASLIALACGIAAPTSVAK